MRTGLRGAAALRLRRNAGHVWRECVRSTRMILLLVLLLSDWKCLTGSVRADDQLHSGSSFAAHDTLACGSDGSADARQCLEGLSWSPCEFSVICEDAVAETGDWLVRFPSPLPPGDAVNDRVAMEWYAVRSPDRSMISAPAVVVVHESGRGMTVGRIIAKGLRAQGFHAFLLHLPGYGARRVARETPIEQMLPALRQAIADVRRARDAVAALPSVEDSLIGLQGTSLGGFVTATVAGLDHGYDRVFILLAGGNLHEVILKGARDAAGIRRKLESAGVTEQQIIDLARPIEPLRLAHRIDPRRTWLFSGTHDDVVPPASSLAFVQSARLPSGHHIELPADHYSGVVFLPVVLQHMQRLMTEPLSDPVPAP